MHKSGFVNIIGNPNVGKSTLMNELVGERLSIITSKAQTTRHRIMGIVNGDDFQIVYSDTPGILEPAYKLQESMLKFVNTALSDADVLLYVTDVIESPEKHEVYLKKIVDIHIPVILLINKTDLTDNIKLDEICKSWKERLPKAEILPVSALKQINLDVLFDKILDKLPEGPEFYPKDILTDKPERFFVAEIVREKILLNYKKEIPYSIEVEVESYKDEEKIVRIRTIIYVSRKSQKGIIIGHRGESIKKVGIEARKDIEAFVGKQVFLELFVKINKDWRENPQQLKRFGYSNT